MLRSSIKITFKERALISLAAALLIASVAGIAYSIINIIKIFIGV